MAIQLNDILKIQSPEHYKLHLACQNPEYIHPLDVFVADRARWLGWNEWRGDRNDWTRPQVLAFMEFKPRADTWLFGGAFEVVERRTDGYHLANIAEYEKYVGRLLASFHRYQGMRGRAFYLEKYLDQITVAEILPHPYLGESFPGFGGIEHDFGTLEAVFRNERADWKAALGSVKGVYLVADRSNGKGYVGSAYGEVGIWSRWSAYMGTGHGWNDGLVSLLNREGGLKHAREHFRFSVLEVMPPSTGDEVVLARETYWKRVLQTREFGYNKN